MTKDEFIQNEIHVWGDDHIESLLEKGYDVVATSEGWKWIYTPHAVTRTKQLSALSRA